MLVRRNESNIYVPGLKGPTLGSVYVWTLTRTPQAAAGNRSITRSRGKTLGGSSALTLPIGTGPANECMNAWGELDDIGWDRKSVISSIIQAEIFREDGIAQAAPTALDMVAQRIPHYLRTHSM